ncbi:MAG: hypothetical protein RI973_814 [Bacteroidota bacterium]|jgi:hypothetical protein
MLTLLSLHGIAQTSKDAFHVNYTFFPKAELLQRDAKVEESYFDIFGVLPTVSIGNQVKLFNSFYYRNTYLFSDDTLIFRGAFPKRLHDLRYTPIMRIPLNTNWALLMLPKIVFRGEMDGSIGGKNFIPQASFLVSYAVKGDNRFRIGLGGGVALFDFKRAKFWPLLQFHYERKKVELEIALPYANFCYKLTEDFEVGLFSMLDNSISAVTPFRFENENATHLRIFQMVVAPTASYRIYRSFFGHIKIGGLTPKRQIRPLDEELKPIDVLKFDYSSSLFFKIGVSYRHPE